MAEKMRGFVVTGPGIGKVDDIEIPELKPGQALVKVEYAGICGGDPGIFANNNYGATPENPRVYGHEFYGEVVAVNNPANMPARIKVGDKVAGPQNAPCGVCDQCINGRPSICTGMYGAYRRPGGAFGEYLERDVGKLFKFDDGVDPICAAVVEPLAVAVFDVRHSGVGFGDKVLIIGGGAVGILIGALARLNGASVFFSEVSDTRIDFLKSIGFEAYNSITTDILGKVSEKTDDAGMDMVFECSGAQPAWDLALKAVKPCGRMVPVGLPNPLRNIDFGLVFDKEIDVFCVNMHQLDDFADAVEVINRGDINDILKKMVTSIWPLELTKEAIEASTDKTGKDVKILLQPGRTEIKRFY